MNTNLEERTKGQGSKGLDTESIEKLIDSEIKKGNKIIITTKIRRVEGGHELRFHEINNAKKLENFTYLFPKFQIGIYEETSRNGRSYLEKTKNIEYFNGSFFYNDP